MIDEIPHMIIIPCLRIPPLLRVIPLKSYYCIEKGQQARIPQVNYTCDIYVAFNLSIPFSYEMGAEDAAQGMGADYYLDQSQFKHYSQDQLGEIFCTPVVAASSLVLSIEAWDGQVDPSTTISHLCLQTCPLEMVSRGSMQSQNIVP